jgi:hypothetical protein
MLTKAIRVAARRVYIVVARCIARIVAYIAMVHVRAQVGLASIDRVPIAVCKARVAHASRVGAAL